LEFSSFFNPRHSSPGNPKDKKLSYYFSISSYLVVMPGSQRNGWSSYLNGGTSHFNFSYKDETPPEPLPAPLPAPAPAPAAPAPNKPIMPPSLPNTPPQPSTPPAANKKKQTGGKRKSRRNHSNKKYRHSRRK
jgi:hypothetical protein